MEDAHYWERDGTPDENVEAEEEEDICRICRCPSEPDHPLYAPCVCTGSIKFVHDDCLSEWLDRRQQNRPDAASHKRRRCELCGYKFSFVPFYDESAPPTLSKAEFLQLSVLRVMRKIPFVLRIALAVVVWGGFVPLATCVMFRILSLSRSDAHEDLLMQAGATSAIASGWGGFHARVSVALDGGLYTSWAAGVFVCGGIFGSFLTLISVVDFVREFVEGRARARRRRQGRAANDEDGDDIDFDDAGRAVHAPGREEDDDDDRHERRRGRAAPAAPQRDAADAAAPPPPQQQQQQQEQRRAADMAAEERAAAAANDGGDDDFAEDWGDGDGIVPLDDMLGLRGAPLSMIHNMLWALTFNGLYLCVSLFAPTTLGAVVVTVLARGAKLATGAKLLTDADEAFLLRTLHRLRAEEALEARELALFQLSQRGPAAGSTSYPSSSMQLLAPSPSARATCSPGEPQEQFLEQLRWAALETGALVAGYVATGCFVWALLRVARTLHARASSARARRSWQRIAKVLHLITRTFKVIIVVFLRMAAFPVALGLLLERATRDWVQLAPLDRFAFATAHPLLALMTLWVAGITHMLVITVLVLELREILHPDILHALIRPKDMEDSLIKAVLEESVARHARRMALSCAIYAGLVLAFVYAPAQALLAHGMGGGRVLPLAPRLTYLLVELQLPAELACVHIAVLNMLDHEGKDYVRDAMSWLCHTACALLGLADYLLPRRAPEPGPGADWARQGVMDPQALMRVPALADLALADAGNESDDDDDVDHRAAPQAPNLFAVAREMAEAERDGDGDDDEDESARRGLLPRRRPPWVLCRLAAFAALAWAVCLAGTVTCASAPLVAGRLAVSALELPITHDPVVYGLGSVLLWRAMAAAAALKLYRVPGALARCVARALSADGSEASLALEDVDHVQQQQYRGRARLRRAARAVALFGRRVVAPRWLAACAASQWAQFTVLGGAVMPWLAGALLQTLLLSAPALANPGPAATCPASTGLEPAAAAAMAAPGGLGAALAAAAFEMAQVPLEQTVARDWLLGVLVCGCAAQALLLRELMTLLPAAMQQPHSDATRALERLVERGDCGPALTKFVVPAVCKLALGLVPPLAWAVALEAAIAAVQQTPGGARVSTLGPRGMARAWVLAWMCAAALPPLSRALGVLYVEAHQLLRDEKYLLGTRLHNLDEGERERRRRARRSRR